MPRYLFQALTKLRGNSAQGFLRWCGTLVWEEQPRQINFNRNGEKHLKTKRRCHEISWHLSYLFHYTFLKLPNFLLSWQPLIKSHCGSINNPPSHQNNQLLQHVGPADYLRHATYATRKTNIYYSKSDEIYVLGLMWLVHFKPRESLIIWEEGSPHRSGSYGMGPELLTALGPWETKTRLNNHNSCWKKGEG